MAVGDYCINIASWGADQNGTDEERDVMTEDTLAVTGSGVWATIDTHRTIRLGGFAFESGVAHRFLVGVSKLTLVAASDIQFRIRDVSAGATIATVIPTMSAGPVALWYPYSDTFANLPSGDAQIELQYTLISPSTVEWFSAFWRVRLAT